MASSRYSCAFTRATARASFSPFPGRKNLLFQSSWGLSSLARARRRCFEARVSDGGAGSYLDMWKKAMDQERKAVEFQKIAENVAASEEEEIERPEVVERKSSEFEKLLEVPTEERDRIQRIQVIDRAAAAISAARALLQENSAVPAGSDSDGSSTLGIERLDDEDDAGENIGIQQGGDTSISLPQDGAAGVGTPGPSFWSWTPPDSDQSTDDTIELKPAGPLSSFSIQANPVMELDRYVDYLSIPLESKMGNDHSPPLPPLQSLMEVNASGSISESPLSADKHEVSDLFSTHAEAAAHALGEVDLTSPQGIYPDGSRWWKETGTEQRPDGVVCRWTLTRGVSADKAVEWEEKYWEAADEFEYKELGSEKSGRDAAGNVWREFWKESMYQIDGCMHIEKTADKWGKNGKGDEWHEKWYEHYGAGEAEKWADKWCSIDPNTQVDVGHAHVWHERWGEKYDGKGGSVKYTDKWAEHSEGDGWTKWGDKWDEHFDPNGHGVKQGETWWEGKYGERWNRTWGEGHNGSGWVHKYGKSSSGEHWDTHVQMDTWYERYPHYGFYHCFENSVPLRQIKKPSEWS